MFFFQMFPRICPRNTFLWFHNRRIQHSLYDWFHWLFSHLVKLDELQLISLENDWYVVLILHFYASCCKDILYLVFTACVYSRTPQRNAFSAVLKYFEISIRNSVVQNTDHSDKILFITYSWFFCTIYIIHLLQYQYQCLFYQISSNSGTNL